MTGESGKNLQQSLTLHAVLTSYSLWPYCCPDKPNYHIIALPRNVLVLMLAHYGVNLVQPGQLLNDVDQIRNFVSFYDAEQGRLDQEKGTTADCAEGGKYWAENYEGKQITFTIYNPNNDRLEQGSATIRDTCCDVNCGGCCTENVQKYADSYNLNNGKAYLIDVEYHTANRINPNSAPANLDGDNTWDGSQDSYFIFE